MANDLTGDFDVVAEFSIPAANRVLAAMHRGKRFPHSMSIQVNPAPPPAATTEVPGRTIRTLVNQYGDALDDPIYVAQPPASLRSVLPDTGLSAVDTLVNPRFARVPGLEPSIHLRGVAQLQLSAPTMIPPDEAGTRITLDMQMMARYFPEPNTRPMPEFLRGGIQTTVDVDQVASPVGNVMDINLKSSSLDIVFSPAFADRTLDPSDVKAIQTVIRNSIQTSFLPSNAVLPSNIQQMQFRTLPGELPALGVLLNMAPDPNIIVALLAGVTVSNDPESVNNVFLQDGDDFALAVGRDFILLRFNLFVSQAFPVRQFTVQSSLADYTVFIDSLTIDLQNGKILTVKGRAITGSVFPNFTFDASQAFKLDIADDGEVVAGTAELALRGDLASSVTSSKNTFSGMATPVVSGILRGEVKKRLGTFLNQAQPTVRGMLSAQKNLGEFLTSLMNPITPPPKPGQEPPETVNPTLAYTSIEIRNSGIVLRGSLAVDDWPAAHVLFEGIPVYRSRANDPTGVNDPFRRIDDVFTASRAAAHDYSALLSWIPGGTVQQYIWSVRGQPQPVRVDSNRFVLMNAPDIPSAGVATSLLGFVPLCLTVAGTRLSASGPVVEEPVSATRCGWSSNPLGVLNAFTARAGGNRFLPDVPLTQMTASGRLEVVGHASASAAGGGSSNVIVHFPDVRTAGALEFLPQALRESERTDAATAILAVLTPDQLARTRHTEGVIYAEDADGAWERLLGVKRRPATIVVGTRGDVVWQHEGELPSGTLAAALKAHLAAGGFVAPRLLRLNLRISQAPPNFLFEYAPGRELTLRKLAGRPVVLVFWKSSSKPSLETVRVLQKTMGQAGGQGPVVLAVNDGEAPELVKKVAAENGLSAIVVLDPERQVSLAYGVNLWPTTVFIDARGLVHDIRYAGFSGEQGEYPPQMKTAAKSPRYKTEAPPKKAEKGKTERPRRTGGTPKE